MMKALPLFYLLAACAIALPSHARLSPWLDTDIGWNAHAMKAADVPGSLDKAMTPAQQHTSRYKGVPTADEVLEQALLQAREEIASLRLPWVLFPSTPPRMMPYLDSIFVPGNICAEPCRIINEDPLSTSAQKIKSAASRIGLHYTLTLSANGTFITPAPRGNRRRFVATNNTLEGTWFLLRNKNGDNSIFLTFEADWGQGIHFSERHQSAQDSIGSLGNPQGSYRGGHGVFIPNLALGCSLFQGKWVGMIGTIDTTNFLDQNAYSADWNGNLMHESFNFNPCLPLEWANWGYLTAWQPNKNFYAMYATTGCNGSINHNPFRTINSRYWVHVSEFGLIRNDTLGLGPGIYRFQYTITENANRTGSGAAINIQQQLGKQSHLGLFSRCGWLDEDASSITGVRACATAGLVLQAPFRSHGWGSASNNDQIAFGFLWERASESSKPWRHQDEYGLELSAVAQLTPTLFLQPDLQYIFNPVHSTGRQGAWIMQVQGVFRF